MRVKYTKLYQLHQLMLIYYSRADAPAPPTKLGRSDRAEVCSDWQVTDCFARRTRRRQLASQYQRYRALAGALRVLYARWRHRDTRVRRCRRPITTNLRLVAHSHRRRDLNHR